MLGMRDAKEKFDVLGEKIYRGIRFDWFLD